MVRQYTLNMDVRLKFSPPEGVPDPGTASLHLFDSEGNDFVGTWPAVPTQDAALATLTQPSETYGLRLYVDDASLIKPRSRYLLVKANGAWEELEVLGSDILTNIITLNQPHNMELDIDDVIQGYELLHTIPAADIVETTRNIRTVWTYEIAGDIVTHQDRFDVVLIPWVFAIHEYDLEELDHRFGEVAGRGRWRSLIKGCAKEIFNKLLVLRLYPDLVRSRSIAKRTIVALILSRFYRDDVDLREYYAELSDTFYREMLDSELNYDSNDDGNTDSEETDFSITSKYLVVG